MGWVEKILRCRQKGDENESKDKQRAIETDWNKEENNNKECIISSQKIKNVKEIHSNKYFFSSFCRTTLLLIRSKFLNRKKKKK